MTEKPRVFTFDRDELGALREEMAEIQQQNHRVLVFDGIVLTAVFINILVCVVDIIVRMH